MFYNSIFTVAVEQGAEPIFFDGWKGHKHQADLIMFECGRAVFYVVGYKLKKDGKPGKVGRERSQITRAQVPDYAMKEFREKYEQFQVRVKKALEAIEDALA